MPKPNALTPAVAWTIAVFVLGVVACGGPRAAPPAAPTSVPVATVAPAGTSAPPAADAVASGSRRTPSRELLDHWAFESAPRLVVYANLDAAFGSPLFQSVVPAALALLKDNLTELQTACIRDVTSSAKELLAGVGDSGWAVVVRYDPATAKTAPASCVEALFHASRETFDVLPGGILVYARHQAERDAAVAGRGKSAAPKDIGLTSDQLAAFTFADGQLTARGGFYASKEHLRIDADLRLPDVGRAEAMENDFAGSRDLRGLRAMPNDPELTANDAAALKRLVGALTITRQDARISLAFDLVESPAQQARDIGTAASLAMAGVNKYLLSAKAAEARNAVGQIGKDLAEWYEREDPAGASGAAGARAKKKLFSLRAVPKTVPRGQKYQSTPDDWKPWHKIYFEMSAPQYYQYEVKAAKDGQSAEILARGDLNGNGKTSLFKLTVKITGDRLVVAPSLVEENPDE